MIGCRSCETAYYDAKNDTERGRIGTVTYWTTLVYIVPGVSIPSVEPDLGYIFSNAVDRAIFPIPRMEPSSAARHSPRGVSPLNTPMRTTTHSRSEAASAFSMASLS